MKKEILQDKQFYMIKMVRPQTGDKFAIVRSGIEAAFKEAANMIHFADKSYDLKSFTHSFYNDELWISSRQDKHWNWRLEAERFTLEVQKVDAIETLP